MCKMIEEEKDYQKTKTYQETLRNIADDFNMGLITFQQHEKYKKQIHKDIFGY